MLRCCLWTARPVDRRYAVPPVFNDVLQTVVDEVCNLTSPEQLETSVCDMNAGPCLQHLLHIFAGQPAYNRIACALLQWPAEEGEPPAALRLCKDRVGSHLVEAILRTCGTDLYSELVTDCFRGRLWDLCDDDIAHFVVGRLVEVATDDDVAIQLVNELSPCIQQLLTSVRPAL